MIFMANLRTFYKFRFVFIVFRQALHYFNSMMIGKYLLGIWAEYFILTLSGMGCQTNT